MILRWYSYRWRVEEYHKIFKSGCQVEKYRLAAEGMKTLIGFLSVITGKCPQCGAAFDRDYTSRVHWDYECGFLDDTV